MNLNPFNGLSDEAKQLLFKKWVGSTARTFLAAGAAFLVTRGYIDQKGADEAVLGITTFLITWGWSFYQKHHSVKMIEVARQAPKGTSLPTIEKKTDA